MGTAPPDPATPSHAPPDTPAPPDTSAPTGVEMYRGGRERLVELCRPLSDEQADLVVPATPEWTVKDAVAHMAGVADDVLAGRLEGVATDAWTAAQVAARRDTPLQEILDELEGHGPAMDALVEQLGDAMDPRLFIDQWSHEQDVRGALGVPGAIDAPVVGWAAPLSVTGWVRRIEKAGLPPISVRCGTVTVEPRSDAVGTLGVDPFTALRVTTGRRSSAQMLALDWHVPGDPSDYLEHLVVFSIPAADVVDAT